LFLSYSFISYIFFVRYTPVRFLCEEIIISFSFGFGLIQESIQRSLYFDFYKTQTERLLNPNTLKQMFKLKLPASELVLNYATTGAGMSQVPDGFRLQNEIVLQESRFSVIDAQIDITTGESTMNLLNF